MTGAIFLVEMGWKSALVSGAALAVFLMLKGRPPAEKAAALRIAVLMLLLLPAVSVLFPPVEVEVAAQGAVPQALLPPPAGLSDEPGFAHPAPEASWGLWIALLYAAGAFLILLRAALGLWTLRRWTGSAQAPESPAWLAALERVRTASGLGPRPRMLISSRAVWPLSWGWRNPVILIDSRSYGRPQDAEAILAHEAAHIRRGDWISLILCRFAVGIFWFNPLVWMIERAMMHAAEEAADREAVRGIEPDRYAQILLDCARRMKGQKVPANSIASGKLARRIDKLFNPAPRPSSPLSTGAAILAVCSIALPLALLKLVPPAAQAETVAFLSATNSPAAPAGPPAAASPGVVPAGTDRQSAAQADQAERLWEETVRLWAGTGEGWAAVATSWAEAERAWSAVDEGWARGEEGRAAGERGRADGELGRATGERSRAAAALGQLERDGSLTGESGAAELEKAYSAAEAARRESRLAGMAIEEELAQAAEASRQARAAIGGAG